MNRETQIQEGTLPFDKRAEDIVRQMSLEEKVSQMLHDSKAIPHLNIPAYNWWNECLHGVGRAGTATVFPQPIGMAASFDENLLNKIGLAISREARAKYQVAQEEGDLGMGKGLTFWAPNINIFRDPRWGRGHETFGEDPHLTARLGVHFIKGLQGNDPYLRVAAGVKHFAVHSGPESERHVFDARVSEKDLQETYLPAFKACVVEANVEAVMAAYNRVHGEPCCGSLELLEKTLRKDWGFKGHVVSDCWGIRDFHENHKVTRTPAESAALAVSNGCDLNCGDTYQYILEAIKLGLLEEQKVNESVVRLMRTRFRLGLFDEDYDVLDTPDPYEIIANEEHLSLARQAARSSMVLLKNKNNILPLDTQAKNTIAIIGPNADSRTALLGNYHGTPPESITVLEGIRRRVRKQKRILYSEGCHLFNDRVEKLAEPNDRLSEAVSMARRSDCIILCLGLDANLEGEQGDISNAYGSGDKPDLALPESQRILYQAISSLGKPLIVLILSGSALWLDEIAVDADAIIQAWYPGGEGGTAITEMLFGDFSPSGRLPVTFYSKDNKLPEFNDYSMKKRTYKFIEAPPLYPFGFGLSYTHFHYSEITVDSQSIRMDHPIIATITVENTGCYASEETVQLYIEISQRDKDSAHWQLDRIKKIYLEPGTKEEVSFTINAESLSHVDHTGRSLTEPGDFILHIGGHQPDDRSKELTGYSSSSCKIHLL